MILHKNIKTSHVEINGNHTLLIEGDIVIKKGKNYYQFPLKTSSYFPKESEIPVRIKTTFDKFQERAKYIFDNWAEQKLKIKYRKIEL